jgi:hypothetical protein
MLPGALELGLKRGCRAGSDGDSFRDSDGISLGAGRPKRWVFFGPAFAFFRHWQPVGCPGELNMNEPIYESIGETGDLLLPCQFNELIRRSSNLRGEYRLLWAVLDDAIRCYLANMRRATPAQRRNFEEVRRWFLPAAGAETTGLFAFQTICDLLEINARQLVRKLESMRLASLSIPRWQHHATPLQQQHV